MTDRKALAKKKMWIFVIIGVVVTGFVLFMMDMNYDNKEQRLRTSFEDQERKIEANMDTMWKSISQTAQIADKYAGDFKEMFKLIAAGREKSGTMMTWIKEQNPNLDADVYKKLMNTVESARMSFERQQRVASEIAREHKNMYVTKPSKWFVSGDPVQFEVISSTRTKEAMKTRKDDDVDLFNKK